MTQDAPDFNPYQPPVTGDLEPTAPVGEAPPPLPWEDKARFPGFWKRVGEMFSLIFNDPLGYFERVPRGEGLTKPWLFQLLLLTPAFLILTIILSVFGLVGTLAAASAAGKGAPPAWLFPALIPLFLLLMPAFVFLGMILGGAFSHFFLWIWGGLKPGQPMEQTIRAQGYANAFISLGGMVPYLGLLVQLAGLIWMGMGLARMHRTDTWRGICAILTPIVLCCCCLVPLILFMVSAATAARH
ncbi:MAG TPA: hypothetical protein VJ505_13945 [Holophagaceae bacterium]|nr:hypothetical protein [Holophagaceae bacterium]